MPVHLPVQSIVLRHFSSLSFAILLSTVAVAQAPTDLKYQQPPKAIVDLVDVLPTPAVSVSPSSRAATTRWMLIQQISGLPPITDLAQPELRLAGLRFNPKTNGPSRGRYAMSLKLKSLPNGKEVAVWSAFAAENQICGLVARRPQTFLREYQQLERRPRP